MTIGPPWWSSDLHLGHANIIKYCKRPFASVEEMDEEIIRRWNERVGKGDSVFLLGDFSLGPVEKVREYRQRLNGHIVLVRGNHDRSPEKMLAAGFDYVSAKDHVHLMKKYGLIYMRHIPRPDWEREFPQSIHLCGHVHEVWKRVGNMINVGVDQWDFRPVSIEELLAAEPQKPPEVLDPFPATEVPEA